MERDVAKHHVLQRRACRRQALDSWLRPPADVVSWPRAPGRGPAMQGADSSATAKRKMRVASRSGSGFRHGSPPIPSACRTPPHHAPETRCRIGSRDRRKAFRRTAGGGAAARRRAGPRPVDGERAAASVRAERGLAATRPQPRRILPATRAAMGIGAHRRAGHAHATQRSHILALRAGRLKV